MFYSIAVLKTCKTWKCASPQKHQRVVNVRQKNFDQKSRYFSPPHTHTHTHTHKHISMYKILHARNFQKHRKVSRRFFWHDQTQISEESCDNSFVVQIFSLPEILSKTKRSSYVYFWPQNLDTVLGLTQIFAPVRWGAPTLIYAQLLSTRGPCYFKRALL